MAEFNSTAKNRGQSAGETQTRQAAATVSTAWQSNGSASRTENPPQPAHAEGTIARSIEQQTAKLPSDLFLWAAGATIGGSLLLHCTGRKEASVLVGQLAPSLLLLGLYNKIVKVLGSDPRPAHAADLP